MKHNICKCQLYKVKSDIWIQKASSNEQFNNFKEGIFLNQFLTHLSIAIKNLRFSKIVSTGLTKTISLTNVQHFVCLSRDQDWYLRKEGQL